MNIGRKLRCPIPGVVDFAESYLKSIGRGKSRTRNPRLTRFPSLSFDLMSNNRQSTIQRHLITTHISWYAYVIKIVQLRMPAMVRFRLSSIFMGKRPPIAMLAMVSCHQELSSCRSYMELEWPNSIWIDLALFLSF